MTQKSVLQDVIRVLHLEDNENDHILVREMFAGEGLKCEFCVAKSRPEFENAIRTGEYDLIISDYTLPSYDGVKALSLARECQKHVPFIFFSGTIGEEIAVDSLKNGATDYVVKQRPQRLVSAVRRALQEVQERQRREQAESALRHSEERFRIVARATNDVIWELDLRTRHIWRSGNFESAFGHALPPTAPLEEAWEAFLHPEDKARVTSSIASLLSVGGTVWWDEYRFRRADGSYAPVLDRAFVVYDENKQPLRMVGVTIDMTERKHAEQKIREQAALLDKAHDAIIVCDLEGRITYWNRSAQRIYGWSAAEATGRRVDALLFDQIPPSRSEARRKIMETGEWFGEYQQLTKNGQQVIIRSSSTLVRDESGNPKSELIINSDITEHRKLEDEFLRAQRLESLGGLVGGIAHDLNNALAPVIMGAGLMRMLPLPPEAMDILGTITASARRGAEMVQQILTFARGGEGQKVTIKADHLAKEMGKIIQDTFPKSIQCRVDVPRDCWRVLGRATQLHQVIMNLCVNARDAMPRGGVLHLSARNVVLDQAQAANYRGGRAGKFLCLSVKDTGVGIPPEQQEQIFQPFFTTKAPGHGTGLGLSTTQSIVKNHGGFIGMMSDVGKGTEFKIFLPAVEVPSETEAEPVGVALPAGRGEGILVVDHEAAIRALAKTALENYGYQVFTAASGMEATAMFANIRDQVQLLITDKSMPVMDGTATVHALRQTNPKLKVILASGHQRKQQSDTERQINASAYIEKPFSVEALLQTVHEVLTTPA